MSEPMIKEVVREPRTTVVGRYSVVSVNFLINQGWPVDETNVYDDIDGGMTTVGGFDAHDVVVATLRAITEQEA